MSTTGMKLNKRKKESYDKRRVPVSFSMERENYVYVMNLANHCGVNRSHALDTILTNYRSRATVRTF